MMRQGRYCIVCGTTDRSITQFSLPTCPERRAKWLSILQVNPCYINSRSRVCSKHFAKNQLVRDRLKADALPKPLFKPLKGIHPPRSKKQGETTSERECIWQDKINLNGRCVFCLEPLEPKSAQRTPQWTSLSHLWPYLQLNGPTIQHFYVGTRDNDKEPIFSQIPPMCTPCLQNINILNSLHHDLEEIKAKLREQEKLVNSAAGRIRNVVETSVRYRKRYRLQQELTISKTPASCISSTTKFLNSLLPNPASSTITIINLTPQVTIEEVQGDPPTYVIVNSVPDQHNLETNCIVENNYTEDLTLDIISPTSVSNAALSDPVNVKTELPEEMEVVTNADPILVKTEVDPENENEIGVISSSQIQTVGGKTSKDLMKNEKSLKTWCSDYGKGNDCNSGANVLNTKFYPNQIRFLPDDEQLIDVPCALSHSSSNNTEKDADPLYDDPLGDT